LIVAVVIIVLFGSKKLPGAARSLGQSMRILKREVSDLHHEEEPDSAPKDGAGPSTQFPPAQLAPAPAAQPADQQGQQGQIDALQQQIRDLQRAATMDTPANAGSTAEPQRTQQPS
jgi:sec-independent protein translocase protein TatA